MTASESKGRFFLQNESIRIDSHNESNRIDSNRELECSSNRSNVSVPRFNYTSASAQSNSAENRIAAPQMCPFPRCGSGKRCHTVLHCSVGGLLTSISQALSQYVVKPLRSVRNGQCDTRPVSFPTSKRNRPVDRYQNIGAQWCERLAQSVVEGRAMTGSRGFDCRPGLGYSLLSAS